MSAKSSRWLIWYGLLLVALGALSVLVMGPKARTGLYAGVGVGVLSLLWGVLVGRRVAWALPVALGNIGFGALAFGWRCFVSFLAYLDGKPERLAPALISGVMCGGAVVVFTQLLRQWRAEEAEMA